MLHRLSRINLVLLAMIAMGALSAGTYLLLSEFEGFPLDDAWIHQTYARNLIATGKWAFFVGEVSGGSTAPLWTLLLTPAYILGLDHRAWSHLLGMAQLIVIAWVAVKWISYRLQGSARSFWLLGLLFLFEWHLVWAALSGMETISMALVAILVLYWIDTSKQVPFALVGAVIGLGVWFRPDALILLAPVAWLLYRGGGVRRLNKTGSLAAGFFLTFVPYLLFNVALSGEIWPNTMFAKQAEYAALRSAPLWFRMVRMLGLPLTIQGSVVTEAGGPLVGVAILLLPGVILDLIHSVRNRMWRQLSPYFWVLGLLIAYAWRLPATYQHGRYMMPLLPVLLCLGLFGAMRWISTPARDLQHKVAQRAWGISAILVTGIFWLQGGAAYAQDIAVIQTEMVATAEWITQSTERDALIAAHDVGALGYFTDREILDLAGLVSPEVVAFIRDEALLMEHIRSHSAGYLVIFPGFYSSSFTQDLQVVFRSEGEIIRKLGGDNMTVYRLES